MAITRRYKFIILVFSIGAFSMAINSSLNAQIHERIERIRKSAAIRAPDFPGNFKWLNIQEGLTLEKLKGKIVLLDFWTYCCINCMHVIPDLRYLEEKYKDQAFIVVGVHSAKFTNERDVENIRQAILRYDIPHPVVVDQNYAIWQAYNVRAWPTIWVIDPEGKLIGQISGEGKQAIFRRIHRGSIGRLRQGR